MHGPLSGSTLVCSDRLPALFLLKWFLLFLCSFSVQCVTHVINVIVICNNNIVRLVHEVRRPIFVPFFFLFLKMTFNQKYEWIALDKCSHCAVSRLCYGCQNKILFTFRRILRSTISLIESLAGTGYGICVSERVEIGAHMYKTEK